MDRKIIPGFTASLARGPADPRSDLLAALRTERLDGVERLERLCRALYDGKLDGVDAEALVLIRAQRDIMTDYVDVLDERISRLKENT